MKKKLILFVFIFVLCIVRVEAFSNTLTNIKQSGSRVSENGYDWLALKYSGSTAVFCTQFNKTSPAGKKIDCTLNSNWNTAVRSGVASIINEVGSVTISGNAPSKYYYGELAINEFLCSSDVSTACVSSNRTPSQILGSNYYLYEAAIDQKDKVNDVIDNISISINNATTTSDSNNYYITTSVSKSKADGYTVSTTNNGTVTKNGDNITITIPKTSLSQGSNSITITVRAYNNEYIARNYSCGTDYQTITPAHTELAEIASKTATKNVTINIQSQGNIEITKTNSETGAAIKDVIFYLYEGTGCDADYHKSSHTTNESGKINISALAAGNYSVLEIESGQTQSILDNYILEVYDRDERCTDITVTAGKTTKKTITNTPKGNIEITKTNSKTGGAIKDVIFYLYEGTGCDANYYKSSHTTNASGKININDLVTGDYSVLEIEDGQTQSILDEYVLDIYDRDERCTDITVTQGNTTTKTITNTPKGNIKITKRNSVTSAEISGVEFNLYSGSGCVSENYIKRTSTNDSGEITFSKLNPGTYSIYERTIPSGYVTPTNRCTNVTVTAGNTTEKIINNIPQAKLKIIKTNSSNDVLASLDSSTEIRFKLYSDSGCNGTAVKDFKSGVQVSGINPGTYYLKEYQTKKGYHLPQEGEAWFCDRITLTAGENKEINITNKTECEYKFNPNMTMKQRIDLYNSIFTTYGHNFNALLNLSNDTAATACRNIPIQKTYETSCLSAQSSSTNSASFSKDNVSMYTEKHGTYTFCLTDFKMDNNLKQNNFSNIKSGQAIITSKNNVAISTGILTRTCYNFGDNNIPDLKYEDYIKTDANIGGVVLDESSTTKIESSSTNSIEITKIDTSTNNVIRGGVSFNLYEGYGCASENDIYKDSLDYKDQFDIYNDVLVFDNLPSGEYSVYERVVKKEGIILPSEAYMTPDQRYTNRCTNIKVGDLNDSVKQDMTVIKIGYLVPYMYASNKDGKIYYGNNSCPTGEYCKSLGRGIISQLNLVPGQYNLGFNIALNSDVASIGWTYDSTNSTDCTYNVVNELIDYKNNVDLEFRTVKTNSDTSFLSKTGTGDRQSGSNWSDTNDRTKVLKENNDSYNKNKVSEPLYKITLTPTLIQQIRNDNKNKEYDDYYFTCKNNGTICISKYLSDLKDKKVLDIYNSTKRTCVESNKDSC